MSSKTNCIKVFSTEAPLDQKQVTKRGAFKMLPIARKFCRNRRGNIGLAFALMIVPVMALTGGALDFNNAHGTKSRMQGALDAATLAGGRELQLSGDADLAWAAAQNYFDAAVSVLPDASFTSSDNKPHLTVSQGEAIDLVNRTVNLKAAAVFKPAVLPIIGISEIEIDVQNAGVLKQGTPGNNGYQNLELALMLDVTGSMGGSKITALKTSAKDLIQIVLDDGVQDEYTSKVALAPFAASVNVGSGSTYINVVTGYTAVSSLMPGLDGLPAELAVPEFAAMTPRFNSVALGFSSALVHKAHHYSNGSNQKKCNKWKKKGKWHKWNKHCKPVGPAAPVTNCVSERTGTNAYTDVAPDFNQSNTLFPNVTSSSNCPSSSATIVPLTNDQDALNDAIDDLPASGMTAGHLGVAWAWYMVSPKWASLFPVESEPAEYEGDTKKVVVLMSDGQFNKRYGGPGSATQARNLCDNMKAEGIEIFTVGFQLTDPTAQETMEYCATAPLEVHRFFADSTDELQQSYRQIGFGLKDLKLSE